MNAARYVTHARVFGGLREVWDTAWSDPALSAVDLGELLVELRRLARRRQRVGRHRTALRETFELSRSEQVALVRRLLGAAVSEARVCRVAGVSRAVVGAIRADGGQTLTNRPSQTPIPRAISRNRVGRAGDSPSETAAGRRTRDSQRRCEWCGAPLPMGVRADARYCTGGACRMASHRARRAASGKVAA